MEVGLFDLRESAGRFLLGINGSLILFTKMAGRAYPVSRALLAGVLKLPVSEPGLWRHA